MDMRQKVIDNFKMECEAEKKRVEKQMKDLAMKLNVEEDEVSKTVQDLVDEGYLEYTKIKTVCPVINPKTRELWGAEAEYWG